MTKKNELEKVKGTHYDVAKAFADSELSGKCYEAAVKFVNELERIKKEAK